MDIKIFVLAARLLLIMIFLVAGLAKLFDLKGSQKAIVDFGLPSFLAAPFGFLLPLTELGICITLLSSSWARWGSIAALILLISFNTAIGINLSLGRKPDCHCFGQLHSKPIGWSTLLRNTGLIVAASIVWTGPTTIDPGVVDWIGSLTATQTISLIFAFILVSVVIVEGWFLKQLLLQHGRLLIRLEALEAQATGFRNFGPIQGQPSYGLSVGTLAPEFQLVGLYGGNFTLANILASGKQVLLIFSDPGCGPCEALFPDIVRWQLKYVELLNIVVISRGTPDTNLAKFGNQKAIQVLLQKDREVA